jgi:uncharacterized membrane protein YidH (DUF202 family)
VDLEVVDALRAAGVPDDKARAVAASLHREIDQRFAFHASQLTTRADLAETRVDLAGTRADLAGTRTELAQAIGGVKLAIAQLEAKTMTAIAHARVDLMKWGLGSMVAMTGIILGAFKLLSR